MRYASLRDPDLRSGGSLFSARRTPSVLLACFFLVSLFSETGVAQEPPAAQPGEAAAAETAVPLVADGDVTTRSQEALAALDRLTAEISGVGTFEAEAAEVAELRARVDGLLPDGTRLDELTGQPALLDGMLVRSRALSNRAEDLINQLAAEAKALEGRLAEVREVTARWQAVKQKDGELPQALAERVGRILSVASGLEKQASGALNEVVQLQNEAMAARNVITPIENRIASYTRAGEGGLFEQNAAPVWRLTSEHISRSSERATRVFAGATRQDFVTWISTSEASIGGHLLVLPVLLLILFRLKTSAAQAPRAALARPAPTAVLIWMLIGIVVYAGAPVTVRVLYLVTTMGVAGVVLFGFVPRNMRLGVVAFLLLAVVERIFSTFSLTEHLPRLAYLLLGVTMMGITLLGLRPRAVEAMVAWGLPRPLVAGSVWVAATLLFVSVLANVLGYVNLSKLLVGGVLLSVAVFLVLFAGLTSMLEIISAISELSVLDRIRSVRANRYRLRRALRRPLVWLSLGLWVWATARAFGIDLWLIESIQAVLNAELTLGQVTLSLRGVAVFVIAVWAAVWVSRIVRAVVDQDILYRMELPRGVPNTISMTLHYSIILIGLLLGVGFMGIDLSSLAFVVGALGVGIGFGLQNVVNNFVSGLILIFEAPIQVGDTVEVGSLMGKVVQIGIRTSRVRTFNGSEVIVPNGDLVSNQVINWTLSDRRRRLELQVGVAYGSDPDRVTEVLRAAVEKDTGVLNDPAPMIVFDAFGDSALNFNVLAWIADFDETLAIRHRLNVAINAALAEAGIEIPFPQRDLHLKSVAEGLMPGASG